MRQVRTYAAKQGQPTKGDPAAGEQQGKQAPTAGPETEREEEVTLEEEGEEDEEDGVEFEISEEDELDSEEADSDEWAGTSEPEVNTGRTAWGEVALQSARKVLTGPLGRDLELFSLTVIPSTKRLSIRLDKLADRYGSPLLDEIESFCRSFNAEFAAALGEEEAGEIEVEVSSPGAERKVRVPADLLRFKELPMKVEFIMEEDKVNTRVLQLLSVDIAAGTTQWALANVRINRQGNKGAQLTRKQRDQRFDIALNSIRKVNLFIDL